jgi:hypothetical protein
MRGGFEADKDEACVADAGIREHALDIGLDDGKHGANEQGGNGQHEDHRAPVVGAAWQSNGEHP